jgi:hypothetical protein
MTHTGLSGLTEELKLATVKSSLGGFSRGELFFGNGQDGQIVKVSSDGQIVLSPWVSLPGEGNGLFRGSLYHDDTEVFAGDLIAVTTSGQVWRITSAGEATQIANFQTHLEGLCVVPDNATKYGPLAGKILIGAEGQNRLYILAADGSSSFYSLDVAIEDIDIVPAGQDFYGMDYQNRRILKADRSNFSGLAGEIILTQESLGASASGLYRLFWDGTAVRTKAIPLDVGSASPGQWEHVTFADLRTGDGLSLSPPSSPPVYTNYFPSPGFPPIFVSPPVWVSPPYTNYLPPLYTNYFPSPGFPPIFVSPPGWVSLPIGEVTITITNPTEWSSSIGGGAFTNTYGWTPPVGGGTLILTNELSLPIGVGTITITNPSEWSLSIGGGTLTFTNVLSFPIGGSLDFTTGGTNGGGFTISTNTVSFPGEFNALPLLVGPSSLTPVFASGPWIYHLSQSNTAVIVANTNSVSGALEIPAMLNGYNVSHVGQTNLSNGIVNPVFSSSSNSVTNVIFSDGISAIAASALAFCPELTAVSVPDSVTIIGDNAFANCPKLSQIRLPDQFWNDFARIGLNTNVNLVNVSVSEVSSAVALSFSKGANSMTNQIEEARTAGRGEVTTNPASFNLFTEQQLNISRAQGRQEVLANPMAHGLYDSSSIMDLRMGGLMIQKEGSNAVVTFQPQTTADLTQPFTNSGTPIIHQIPMPGNKGFIRIDANPNPTPAPPQP